MFLVGGGSSPCQCKSHVSWLSILSKVWASKSLTSIDGCPQVSHVKSGGANGLLLPVDNAYPDHHFLAFWHYARETARSIFHICPNPKAPVQKECSQKQGAPSKNKTRESQECKEKNSRAQTLRGTLTVCALGLQWFAAVSCAPNWICTNPNCPNNVERGASAFGV